MFHFVTGRIRDLAQFHIVNQTVFQTFAVEVSSLVVVAESQIIDRQFFACRINDCVVGRCSRRGGFQCLAEGQRDGFVTRVVAAAGHCRSGRILFHDHSRGIGNDRCSLVGSSGTEVHDLAVVFTGIRSLGRIHGIGRENSAFDRLAVFVPLIGERITGGRNSQAERSRSFDILADRRSLQRDRFQITFFIVSGTHEEIGGRVLELIGQTGSGTKVIALDTIVRSGVSNCTQIIECLAVDACPGDFAAGFDSVVGIDHLADTADAQPCLAIIQIEVAQRGTNTIHDDGAGIAIAACTAVVGKTGVGFDRIAIVILFHAMDIVIRLSVTAQAVTPIHHLHRTMMDLHISAVRSRFAGIQSGADLQTGAGPLGRVALVQNTHTDIKVTCEGLIDERIFIIVAPVHKALVVDEESVTAHRLGITRRERLTSDRQREIRCRCRRRFGDLVAGKVGHVLHCHVHRGTGAHFAVQDQCHTVTRSLLDLGHRLACHGIIGGLCRAGGIHRFIEGDTHSVLERLNALDLRSFHVSHHRQFGGGGLRGCLAVGRVGHFQSIGAGIRNLRGFDLITERIGKKFSTLSDDFAVFLPNISERIVTADFGLELICRTGSDLLVL